MVSLPATSTRIGWTALTVTACCIVITSGFFRWGNDMGTQDVSPEESALLR